MTAPGYERVLAPAALALALCWAGAAAAHAPPAATEIQWQGERALVRTNRGLIGQDADGGSFRMLCNDAFRVSLSEVPPFTITSDGRILVGTFEEGLLLSTADRCSFAATTGALSGINAVAIAQDAAGVIHALIIPPDGSPAALVESHDDGRNFDAVATFDDPPSSLQVAPGDANRLYVSVLGANANETFPRLLRSADAGRTFEELPLALDASELRAFVLAVDPLDPERLFVRTQSRDGITDERLLRSDDGGQSFETVLEAQGPLSVTVAADGTVWAGSALGVYLSSDGGRAFAPLAGLEVSHVTCLATRAERLYVCGYQAGEFGVLVSEDQGDSLAWFLRFPQVETRLGCAAQSDEGSLCEAAFDDWSSEQNPVQSSAGASGRTGGGSKATAAGCGLSRLGPPVKAPFLLLLPLLLAAARARRATAHASAHRYRGRRASALALTAALLLACGSNGSSDAPSANGGGGDSSSGGNAPNQSGGGSGAAPGATATGGPGDATAGASASENSGATFEESCLARAASACERCLCTDCANPVQSCGDTSGCPEIATCIRDSQCAGIACYCGSFDAVACATGQSDGPCKATILAAPGSRVPTLLDPSAGPASDAAVAIAACAQPGQSCAAACPTGG
jgi:hypothetical protein